MVRAKRWGALALALASGLGLMGCPKEKPAETNSVAGGGGGKAAKEDIKIAVIPKGLTHQFWQSVHAGAEAAGKEEGVQIIWGGPSNETDITEQKNFLDTQVNNHVNGIVLAATSAQGMVPPVKAALAKGVPVVTIDSGLDPDVSLAYIATDNVKGGELAADELAKDIGGKGKVGLIEILKGAASSDQRDKGFLDEIAKKYPDIKIVSQQESKSQADIARNVADNMLTANPDMAGIFATSEPGGVGAGAALKQKGLAGKVKLIAFDSSDEEDEDLQSGVIQALIVQDPYQMGYKGVKTVLKAIRKEPITEKFVDSGVTVVTKENMNTPEVQKLIHPAK